jgi:hypothetical protein
VQDGTTEIDHQEDGKMTLCQKRRVTQEEPVIPIAIGPNTFEESVCDFGASVNIMPKVIYENNSWRSIFVDDHVFVACRSVTLLPEGHS